MLFIAVGRGKYVAAYDSHAQLVAYVNQSWNKRGYQKNFLLKIYR